MFDVEKNTWGLHRRKQRPSPLNKAVTGLDMASLINIRIRAVLFAAIILVLLGCASGSELNDIHSQLNATRVDSIHYPTSTDAIVKIVKRAKTQGKSISISGSRHAMGGQQFGEGTIHISMSKMSDVIELDRERGIVRVEAGIEWPELLQNLLMMQEGSDTVWTIVQKQTGADQLSIGGAMSANAHGRGVDFKPFVQDVESFTMVNADGEILNVSRDQHSELFRLVIGGYGLFGVIATVDLRLMPRMKLERVVEVVTLSDLSTKVEQRLEEGFLYGDFQYKTDGDAKDFMQIGVLSAYKPVPDDTPLLREQRSLSRDNWYGLLELAHTDKSAAFEKYSKYYLTTDGQIYWSDLHQMSEYLDDYVDYLNKVRPDLPEGSLMITELYVPRNQVDTFIHKIIQGNQAQPFNIVYGTLRLIQQDDETFLPWAKEDYACIIFNLRVEWSKKGREKAKRDFQRLIDGALEMDGSYFLTYHRWARKDQVLKAYPQFIEFLRMKLKYDPEERFQSEWYRHYKQLFYSEL
jgi:FAD/FMN-containing dehydrogenase